MNHREGPVPMRFRLKLAAKPGFGDVSQAWAGGCMLDSLGRGAHNTEKVASSANLRPAVRDGCDFGMSELLQRPETRLVILAAVTAALAAVGIYVVAKVRRSFVESGPTANDLITNFRELHSEGELSDEEYRTIKATLAARLQQQLKGRNQAG